MAVSCRGGVLQAYRAMQLESSLVRLLRISYRDYQSPVMLIELRRPPLSYQDYHVLPPALRWAWWWSSSSRS